jgi:CubicO group peptidase (beta-lactamase class C family)
MRKAFILLIILFGCNQKEQTTGISSQIENGLIEGEVYFEGDKTLNIEERMKFYGVPGVSIAVIQDNKVVWSKGYGIMDKETDEPVTTKTLFQAGSISKPVAAYGALKAVEDGKVSLTEDVNKYLTTWKIPDNEFTKEKKVTLAQLLSHTGGLTVHGFFGYSPDLPVPTLVQVLDGTAPANSPPIRVDKEPGGNFRYSGGGYSVMQQMMIDVYGKPYAQIEKELVLDPLHMDNSTYEQPLDAGKIKMAATGYLPNHEQTKGKRHTYPEMAAAGLWTTAEDLAKFAIDVQMAVKGESKIITKQMVDRMLTPVDEGYGLGLSVDDRNGDVYFGHGGWDEGFSSEMVAHRDKGYGIVVLTNSNHPPFISEVIRSVARAYNWGNYVKEYKKLSPDNAAAEKAVGRYRNGSDGRITVTREGDKLLFKFIRSDRPDELTRVSDSTYVLGQSRGLVQFKERPGDPLDLVITGDRRHAGSHPKVDDNEVVPYEYLIKGDFDNAVKGYQALLKANPKDHAIDEAELNFQGYTQLENGNKKLALDIFRVNTILYPNSSNVYDSYGDAQRANDDNKGAVDSYKKALKLNPGSEGTSKKLTELENVSKK